MPCGCVTLRGSTIQPAYSKRLGGMGDDDDDGVACDVRGGPLLHVLSGLKARLWSGLKAGQPDGKPA